MHQIADQGSQNWADPTAAERPYTLVAELTYRCALKCAYCSNPVEPLRHPDRLGAADWIRVLHEAADLGVVQVHLSGGEPLLRPDLEHIVRGARSAGLYVNLITSGVPVNLERLRALREAGLDAIQLSIQDADPQRANDITGTRAFSRKLEVAAWARELEVPLTLNVVLHRRNIDAVPAIVSLAEAIGVDRLELANTQYLGSALQNRAALLPTRAQLERARADAAAARARLAGRLEVVFVLPDYHAGVPRACMGGWGRRFVVVSPDGLLLPCHMAHTIATLTFERVGVRALGEVWRESEGLRAFRGEDWMRQPCRTCPRKSVDFGGCRCQAYHLTGDAAEADPACELAPSHSLIRAARDQAERAEEPIALRLRMLS